MIRECTRHQPPLGELYQLNRLGAEVPAVTAPLSNEVTDSREKQIA